MPKPLTGRVFFAHTAFMRTSFLLGFVFVATLLTGCRAQATGDPTLLTKYNPQPASPVVEALKELAGIKQDLQTARAQLDGIEKRVDSVDTKFKSLNLTPQAQAPVIEAKKETITWAQPAPVERAKKPETKKETPKGTGVYAVRVGTHADTVRIVLDATSPVKAETSVDSGEKLLTIALPNVAWSAPMKQALSPNQALVAAYEATKDNTGGVTVVFALKGDTKIVQKSVMKNPDRLVIDLKR